MTAKQAAKIAKVLLPDLPGFVIGKKMAFKSPIDDFLRAVYFENTSDVNRFHFHVFLMSLLVPQDYISFSYGDRIGNSLNWRLDNPSLLSDLRTAIHSEAVPFLNKLSTHSEVIDYLKAEIEVDPQRVNPHTLEDLAYALIRTGDYPSALKALEELDQRFSKSTTSWLLELVARAKSVEEKLLRKPEAALAQLEAWKAETVRKLGLEKYCAQSAAPLS